MNDSKEERGQSFHYLAKDLKEEGEEVEEEGEDVKEEGEEENYLGKDVKEEVEEETWKEHMLQQVDDENDGDEREEMVLVEGMMLQSTFSPLFKHKASGWLERIEREKVGERRERRENSREKIERIYDTRTQVVKRLLKEWLETMEERNRKKKK